MLSAFNKCVSLENGAALIVNTIIILYLRYTLLMALTTRDAADLMCKVQRMMICKGWL